MVRRFNRLPHHNASFLYDPTFLNSYKGQTTTTTLKIFEHLISSLLRTLAHPTMNLLNILRAKQARHSHSESLRLMGKSLLMFC